MQNDTIVAVATSMSEAAISIIRLSGDDAINIVDSMFSKNINNAKNRTIHYGYIEHDNKRIDEVLVSVFKAPKTFTVEDVVEINCHGGMYITKYILELCLQAGARLAEPGEFTKRAFLNGRIDLAQAEAISDMISAKTRESSQLAMKGIDGRVSGLVKDLKEDLIKIITQIEVNIDYPEYDDIEELTATTLLSQAIALQSKMSKIIDQSHNGQIIKDGIKTAIIGRPNVGKSSLLNELLQEDKAIVTDIAGTTRDVIEGYVNLDGIVLNLIDTAGIRDTYDIVEKIGVERSKKAINEAQLVLLVLDGSQPLSIADKELIELTKDKKTIYVLNKMDLGKGIEVDGVEVSALHHFIDPLEDKIRELFDLGTIKNNDNTYISNVRHIDLLNKASSALSRAIEAMHNLIPTDLIVVDLYEAWINLKEILGEESKEDFFDELFKRFCIGK